MSRANKELRQHYTLSEIERALRHEPLMYSYAEAGDFDIIHLIMDARASLERAKPTEVQLKTVELVWRKGLSLVEAGRLLGVTPQAVKFNLDLLQIKIKKVLDEWTVLDREEFKNEYSSSRAVNY